MRRQVRIADSPGRPSRRKNEPGILPAAYMRSSTSTVSGKKSMPSRGFEVATVDRSVVSPTVTSTAPAASLASLPVSNVIVSPAAFMGPETRMASVIGTRSSRVGCEGWRFPVVTARGEEDRLKPWPLTTPYRGSRGGWHRPPRSGADVERERHSPLPVSVVTDGGLTSQ